MLRTILIIGVISVTIVGFLSLTGCHHRNPEEKAEYIVEEITERLKLDESQQELLVSIKDRLLEKGKAMREDHESNMDQILAQLESEAIDELALTAIYNEKKAKMDEMSALMISSLAEFHRSLSPEQRAELVSELERMKEKRGRYCRFRY